MPKGFSSIWHRLTGRYTKVKAQNEREALEALHRDRAEKDAMIFKQIEERQAIQRDIRAQREAAQQELLRLREDVAHYMSLDQATPERVLKPRREMRREDNASKRKSRQRRNRAPKPGFD